MANKKILPINKIESISNFKMITQGNTAEVYSYDENKILKLFRQDMPKEAIFSEYEKVSKIQLALKNVPKVYEIVFYKNRYGIIYERVTGIDMIKIMLSKPHKMNFYARNLAHYHKTLLNNCLDIGISVKQKLNTEIDLADDLSKANKKTIKDYLNDLPDGNNLCHFDFHPGNVMMDNNKPVIIDFMTACMGDPNADVARTYILLKYGELPHANFFVRKLVQIFKKHIGKIYYQEYKKITGVSNHDIEKWILPIAAARLMEWIPDAEKENLLKVIKDKLQSLQ